MVIVVAIILSLAHEIFKGKQQENAEIDKMTQILRSVKIEASGVEAEKAFNERVTEMYMIDMDGTVIPDSKEAAFNADMKVEMAKSLDKRHYPVYEVNVDGQIKYILALYGSGLWGPIWGYAAVEADGNTIYGVDFSHASETPGLGAEISLPFFSDEFVGKQIFKDQQFKSVAVVKPGKGPQNQDYVDGVSGGTITSNGVDRMLLHSLEGYSKFLVKLQNKTL